MLFYRIWSTLVLRLFAWGMGLFLLVSIALTLGQSLRLRSLLWPLNHDRMILLFDLCRGGSVILFEAAAPIITVFAILLTLQWARREGLCNVLTTSGHRPFILLPPLLIFTSTLGGLSLITAHYGTPLTLNILQEKVIQAAQTKWREALPLALSSQFTKQLSLSRKEQEETIRPSYQLSSWLMRATPIADTDQGMSNCLISANFIEASTVLACWPEESSRGKATSSLDDNQLELTHLSISSPQFNLLLDSFTFPIKRWEQNRLSSTFGPPNSLFDHELDPKSRHHRFIWHKRSVLPLAIFPLSLLAFYCALTLSTSQGTFVLLLTLSLFFASLRHLELACRAGWLPPYFAAWLPFCVLMTGSIICSRALEKPLTPPRIFTLSPRNYVKRRQD